MERPVREISRHCYATPSIDCCDRVLLLCAAQPAAAEIPPIPRVLPPEGLEIPADVRERLEAGLAATKKRLEAYKDHALLPDVEIFTKAVELALVHREFYVAKDFAKADWALDEANKRLDSLDKRRVALDQGHRPGRARLPLARSTTRPSPTGWSFPQDHDFGKPCPLYVWLHGRGDKNTDLHFLARAGDAGRPDRAAGRDRRASLRPPLRRLEARRRDRTCCEAVELGRRRRYKIDRRSRSC